MAEEQLQEDTPSKVTRVLANKLVLYQYFDVDTGLEEDFELGGTLTVKWGDYSITAPAGISTDLASKPVGRKSGKWNIAVVIHDFLYNGGEAWCHRVGANYQPTREEADRIMADLMIVCKVPTETWQMMYAAVTIFGLSYWKGRA